MPECNFLLYTLSFFCFFYAQLLQGPVRFNDQGIRILNELIIFQFRNVTSGKLILHY